jgi:hypothetical protein
MLLNTDLHVAQGDYKKMTRSEFVKNTMDSIYAQISSPASAEDDSLSDDQLTSGISFQSLDWVPLQRTPSNQSAFSSRSSNYARSFDSSSNRGSNPAPLGSKVWQTEMKVFLKQIYTNIRHNQIADPSSPPTSIRSSRVSTVLKRSVGTIIWKGGRDDILSNQDEESPISYPISPVSTISTQRPPRSTFSGCRSISSASSNVSNSLLHYQSIASYLQHTELPTTYTSNAPYYKEGMVTRKHLLEKANHKAKHRDWKDCFMVIDRSQLRMYKLDANSHKYSIIRSTIMANRTSISDNASQVSDSSSEAHAVGGGDWLSNAQLIGIIDLKHTLATPLTSGYSRQRQHAFALQQPSGGVYLFQAGSNEQIQEWVSTCNYWAARESKEPMAAAVGSMEYGWCNCLERSPPLDDITIHEWRAPLLPTISSLLEEAAQLDALHKYVQELNNELDQHHDIKPKMELLFSSHSKNAAKVNANWENKSTFLLHEIIKYQNYCDSIEKSLALQAKVMEPQH